MAKRKRQGGNTVAFESSVTKKAKPIKAPKTNTEPAAAVAKPTISKAAAITPPGAPETIQIIAGSYDRVLHGLTATIETTSKGSNGKGSAKADAKANFADTFLFNAHDSAIRCVAVSPPSAPIPGQSQKVLLASGSTDERINIYNLSAHPPNKQSQEALSAIAPRPILENRKNRELGTLLHHGSSITSLCFPTRSKLLSGSDDSTVGVTRTRDWSLLSSIKAPIPVAQGRPSGDTAAFGATPSGINDFAVHPSMKLMVSVSKGERCMRLWNLVTGKKAGVLNFEKKMLSEVGEARFSSGEGRKLAWGSVDGADEFAVGFDKDIVAFGMDSTPKCRIMGNIKTKVHAFRYITIDAEAGVSLMAVATEDGRVIFFSTSSDDLTPTSGSSSLPTAKPIAFIGGKAAGVTARIKDFTILESQAVPGSYYVVGGCSDGTIRAWTVTAKELLKAKTASEAGLDKPVGSLAGKYETQNRITCLTAFLMIPRPEDVEESEDEEEEAEAEDSEDSD